MSLYNNGRKCFAYNADGVFGRDRFVSAEQGPREGEMSPDIQRLLRRMRGGAIAGVYTD